MPRQLAARQLRSLLDSSRTALLAGAHDAVSARLVEETGFDGIWAGSFGMSLASRCAPDADLLTMTESLEIMRRMVRVAAIPVIADCNAGYGNAINVMLMVNEFERAGVAGVCIEDNAFPKRSSLYDPWERQLVTLEEMAGKIKGAIAARQDPDFVIIARSEALIAGEGLEAALRRAYAYDNAGADALVMHARSLTPLLDFVKHWDADCPLVVIPTLFGEVSVTELRRAGFRMVIFPNQAVRASIRAMQRVLETLHRTGAAEAVDEMIAPLSEVYRLTDLEALRDAERAFVVRPHSQEIETYPRNTLAEI